MKPTIDLERFPAQEPVHDVWAAFIRRNAAIVVANDLLAKLARHERLTEVRAGDDMHLAALCLSAGLTARDMNVVGCASLIAEMVLLFEWDIEDDDMEGGFAVLRDMHRDDPDALPAFVTRVNLMTFSKAYLAVRARIDDISDAWMCEMRRHLVKQYGPAGWQAELMPITH